MVFGQVKQDDNMRIQEVPVMSSESALFGVDSPKSNNSIKLSALRTKSSKRSAAYSKDQVKQLIELFPEISHLKKRAETESLEELFPDALAELVEILGTTKKVEQELFRRKEAKEKQARRTAEREARKTTGVRFASTTNESRVFECLESEALRRAGIAEQALANATAARDKVHKLYKGLIATTNPVKCDRRQGQGDDSTVSSMHRMPTTSTDSNAEGDAAGEKTATPNDNANNSADQYPGSISKERWESLRSDARVVITRRLLVGWKMSSESCRGSECKKCPLLMKQKKMQCVVCGGSGSGKDGMYVNGKPTASAATATAGQPNQSTGAPTATSSNNNQASSSKRPKPSQILRPNLIDEVLTPESQDSQDSPSNVLGKLTRKIDRNYKKVAEASAAKAKSIREDEAQDRDEFENLLEQQRKAERRKNDSVIVYDVADDSDTNLEEVEIQKRNTYHSEVNSAQSSSNKASVTSESGVPRDENSETPTGTHSDTRSSGDTDETPTGTGTSNKPRSPQHHIANIQLDDKEKQDILEEVQSILTKSVTSSKRDLSTRRSQVGQEILLKTEQGWSLIDASCNTCDMPLLIDPTGQKELCVFCEVKRKQQQHGTPEIHIDQTTYAASEITDSLYGRAKRERSPTPSSHSSRKPPASVTVVHAESNSEPSRNSNNENGQRKDISTAILPPPRETSERRKDRAAEYDLTRSTPRKGLDQIERQLRPVASPSIDDDNQGMFQSLHNPAAEEYVTGRKPEVESRYQGGEDSSLRALRQVASPDFDDKNMFPFLKEGRKDAAQEDSPEFDEKNMFPFLKHLKEGRKDVAKERLDYNSGPESPSKRAYTPRTHRRGESGHLRDQPVSHEPQLMGILPRRREAPESQSHSQSQLQPNRFAALQYARHSSSRRQDGHPTWSSTRADPASQQTFNRQWQEEELAYEEPKGIERVLSTSSVSVYEVPEIEIEDLRGLRERKPLYEESFSVEAGSKKMHHHYDQMQGPPPWQPSHSNVYSVHTNMDFEARQGSPEPFYDPQSDIRDGAPHRSDLPDHAHGRHFPYAAPSGAQSTYRGADNVPRFGTRPAKDVNEEMKIRVAENIKAGRMNGPGKQKKIRTSTADDSQLLTEEAPVQYISPRGKSQHSGNPSSSQPSGTHQPLSPSTNFYEQLQSRAEYAAWQPNMGENNRPNPDSRQINDTDTFRMPYGSQQGAAASMQGEERLRFNDSRISLSESESIRRNRAEGISRTASNSKPSDTREGNQMQSSFRHSGQDYNVDEALPGQVSMLSELASTLGGPLTSVREIPNEMSSPNAESQPDHPMPNSTLVGQDFEPARGAKASNKETISCVSSLGVQGMEDTSKGSQGGASSTELLQSRKKALMDDISVSSKEPAMAKSSSSSKESASGGSESLLSSIRFHGQAGRNLDQDHRSDPPDAPLHLVVRGSRAGRDPEEGRGSSPRRAWALRSPIIESPRHRSPSKPDTSKGGYSIVVPEGFDFSDEEQLRKLFLSAKKHSEQNRETNKEKMNSSNKHKSPSTGSPWLQPPQGSGSKDQEQFERDSNLKTSSSKLSSTSKSSALPLLPSLHSTINTSDSGSPEKHAYHAVGATTGARHYDYSQNTKVTQDQPQTAANRHEIRPLSGTSASQDFANLEFFNMQSKSSDQSAAQQMSFDSSLQTAMYDFSEAPLPIQELGRVPQGRARWSSPGLEKVSSRSRSRSPQKKSPAGAIDGISSPPNHNKQQHIREHGAQQETGNSIEKAQPAGAAQNTENKPLEKNGSSPRFTGPKPIQEDDVKPEIPTRQDPANGNGSAQNMASPKPGGENASRGYLDSLIESIRAPVRVWDQEIPREGRSDPPACEAPPQNARVALDPDVEVENATDFHHLHLHLQRQQNPQNSNASKEPGGGGRQLDQNTRGSMEPSGVNGKEVSHRSREPEDGTDIQFLKSTSGVKSPRNRKAATKKSKPSSPTHKAPRGREPTASDEMERETDSQPPSLSPTSQARVRQKKREDSKSKSDQGPDTDSASRLNIDEIKIPGTSRNRKTCPKPEVTARERQSKRSTRKQRDAHSEGSYSGERNDSQCPSDETGVTPVLEPRVQSPDFDGISALDQESDSLMKSPGFPKARRNRSWASEQESKFGSSRKERLPALHLPPSGSRRSTITTIDSYTKPFSARYDKKKMPKSREASYGEDAASPKSMLLASTTMSSPGKQNSWANPYRSREERRKSYGTKDALKASSSVSSWTTDDSFGPKEDSFGPKEEIKKTRRKSSDAARRVGDHLRFGAKPDVSVASSNSSFSSWSPRLDKKKKLLAKDSARPRSAMSVGEDKDSRWMKETSPKLQKATRSFGSYSSWATREKSEKHVKETRRGKLDSPASNDEDEELFFVGGPLERKRSTDLVASPGSDCSDSTPFEDILNRCKNKLEQLSVPEDENDDEDDDARLSRPGIREFRSYASTVESQVIDLVDIASDARSTRSGRTSRSARSRRSTRSSRY